MISKSKEQNQSFTSSNPLPDKSYIPQITQENQHKSFSNKNISNYKTQSPTNRKKKISNQVRKRAQFSDFSSGNLMNSVKKQNCSYSTTSKETKPFSGISSKNQLSKNMSIKSLENYIKQKIIDMNMKLGKEDIDFSEIENINNFNITIPFKSMNRNNKKLCSESMHESSSHLSNIKKDKKKINNQHLSKISINNSPRKKEFSKKTKEKIFRKIEIKKLVYDSIDDSDTFYERDRLGFYISSDSAFALIFDSAIFLCALFDVIYTPFRLSLTVCFSMDISQKLKYIYSYIDLLYISDLILSFFRSQHNEDLKIIKESEIMIKNYFENQFFADFLEGIPIFSIISSLCKNNDYYCIRYSFSFKQSLLLFFCYFKQLKLIKIIDRNKNSLTNKILYIIANKHNITKKVKLIQWAIFCLYALYTFISIHIFIGHLSYPNWIVSMNLQNENYFSLYITSFYFLMATVTTVGYGDIVCKSTIEICIQLIFLTVGVFIYSWIISNIGNYIQNQDRAAIKCNKDKQLLEEIRIAYPEMPFKLYNKILQHLQSRRLRQQKCEANILINSLPYSLRNHLLLTMYKQTTNQLKICKNSSNSDFIIKLLTNFIPLFSKKNSLLIHDGELIESIVFVNDGRLALEASINMEFPENSIYQYLYVKFKDIIEIGGSAFNMDSSSQTASHFIPQNYIDYRRAESILGNIINNSSIKNAITSGLNETSIGRQVGKYEYEGNFDENNYKYVHIINILKNESYGSIYMFLDKPSPLSLRVKSKKADLLLLRKFDAFAISRLHPNIWKRFQKKTYLNMVSVKNLTIKILKNYSKNNNIVPIQRKSNRKCTSDLPFHDIDNNSNNKDIIKSSNKSLIKTISNSSANQKLSTNLIIVDSGTNKLSDKEQNNDFLANITKVLNSKKNDNINENQNINFNLNSEKNKESNNDLNKHIKKVENIEVPSITINKIFPVEQNNKTENKNSSSKKTNFLSLKNLDIIQKISGNIENRRKTSFFNANTASFFNGQNFEQSLCISFGEPKESKKRLSMVNSGIISFRNKLKNSDKKSEINENEKMENKSNFNNICNNQLNQDLKSSNISNYSLFLNKKGSQNQKNSVSSNSAKENKKIKLNTVGKIRLKFIRKLTKKIKLLKTEKNKYKTLSKSLTHNFNEFVRKQTTKPEDKNIKNITTLENAQNKNIVNDTENKNQISISNNITNNISLKDANKFIVQMPEFSQSGSSKEISSSSSHSKNFDLNEMSISSPIRFMCKSNYKNLNIISFGYYAKSKKLRKLVINIINGFLSIKKGISNEEKQKDNKKYKINSSKSDSLNEYFFQIFTGNISENEKKSKYKTSKISQFNSDNHYNMTNLNSILTYKKYKNDENIDNIINDNNCGNKYDNNDTNYNSFTANTTKNQGEGSTNIIKLQNMNYLSNSPNRQIVNSSNIKEKDKNYFALNNFKQKIFNNSRYEYEHIFANNNINGNLKKINSANEDANLMRINSINFFYIKNNTTKYLAGKKMKIEDVDELVNNKSISNSSKNNKNGGGVTKSSIKNDCYIF